MRPQRLGTCSQARGNDAITPGSKTPELQQLVGTSCSQGVGKCSHCEMPGNLWGQGTPAGHPESHRVLLTALQGSGLPWESGTSLAGGQQTRFVISCSENLEHMLGQEEML